MFVVFYFVMCYNHYRGDYMIYFDKKTLAILKCITKNEGITERELRYKFGNDISMLLINFVKEQYVIADDENNNHVTHDKLPYHSNSLFTYYPTSKGNELVETRVFNFWKWTIPTFISILSLLLSIITFLLSIYGNDIIKVHLLK